MDMSNGPGMLQPSPGTGTVLASLKRNVLWGVLGLVALVFTTVCVMYVSSRQTEAVTAAEPAADLDAAPEVPATAAVELPAPAPIPVPAAPATQTVAMPPAQVIPTLPAPATTPVKSGALKPEAPVTTAKVETKPAAKTESKPVAKPTAPKALDQNNLPHGTKLYTIKSGDTLEKIAKEVYGDGHKWKRLAELNKDYVTDLHRLKVGQKILVERTPNPRDYADY